MWSTSKYLLLAAVVVCLSACFRLYSQLSSLNISTLIYHQFKARAPPPTISFYKLSLQWPPAACNGTLSCKPPIPSNFTIHGIWPQDRNDEPIPPYNKRNPCTPKTPTPPTVLPIKLRPIEVYLMSEWPNLTDGLNLTANYQFWEYEWKKHGTCSDYPDDPLTYFKSALKLRLGINTIVRFGRQTSWTVQQVAHEVFDVLKAYPEIACNLNPSGTQKQLWEIRLCYDRPNPRQPPHVLINCTNILRVSKGKIIGPCKSLSDTIFFP
ncbi:hypothetical protein Golob_004061 [Gossypium lobatum]|uniref:Uncharacterized protein n=1 Tax=Gossypium lobatum TaxID=34289 RepID=A0A7J8N0K9_9ROSI|nr:hypothetical protein [Gossypium lobatum]